MHLRSLPTGYLVALSELAKEGHTASCSELVALENVLCCAILDLSFARPELNYTDHQDCTSYLTRGETKETFKVRRLQLGEQ